jgi:DNA-binding Lrp family transcriptional regulator
VARFPEVQEVHLISGEWDFLIKIRAPDVAGVGNFLAEKLRTVKGIDKTITCMVFETAKETTEIDLSTSAGK